MQSVVKILIHILLCIGFHLHAKAQVQPAFINIQEDKGLQSNLIYNLHVAKNGLLYIAHSKGLSSFDGNHFIHYFNRDYPYTELTNIIEDKEGNIFAKAFNNGLYQLVQDTLRHFKTVYSNLGFSPSGIFNNAIISMIEDSILFTNTKNNRSIAKPLNLSKTSLTKVANPVFIGSGLMHKKPILIMVDSMWHSTIISDNQLINCNHHQYQQDIFFTLNKSLDYIQYYNTGEIIHIPSFNQNTSVNYITTAGNTIWVCTTDGIYYRPKQQPANPFTHILKGYNVSSIEKTQEDNYFVSTIGQGLLFIPNFNVQVIQNIATLTSCISGFQNELYIGTPASSIITYDLLKQEKKKEIILSQFDAIKLIYKEKLSQQLIISGKKSFLHHATFPLIIKDFCYVGKQILLATNSGVYLYNPFQQNSWLNTSILQATTKDKKVSKLSFSNEHTSNIKFNPVDSTIYISNYSGLFYIRKNQTTAHPLPEPHCVLKDIIVWNNQLYLATKDKGLLVWNGQTYVQAFSSNPTDGILYKLEVYDNELWIIGENALFCYKKNQLFRYADALGIKAKNIQSIYLTEKEVFINTGNSIIQFGKQILLQANSKPSFILNKVIDMTTQKRIQHGQSMSYHNNVLQFHFSIISYANAANTHIAYQLNQQELIHLPSDARQITLNSLGADNYTIKFYMISNNTIPKAAHFVFNFIVQPPFYKTWWFYTASFFCFLAISYWIVATRIKKIKAALALKQSKLLLEKELDKSTLQSIKAQMNPHFIFNALNTIQSYIYLNDKRNASIYISKFSDLTRSILDMSNKEYITIQEEIQALEVYLSLEKMRFEETFNYTIHIDESLSTNTITIPSMLIQPYVENAIKHGLLHKKNNRQLNLYFKQHNNCLQVEIDDNGIGRKQSQAINRSNQTKHQSFAMHANKKRLDILQQHHANISLNIIDKYSPLGQAEGTLVIIQLPLLND